MKQRSNELSSRRARRSPWQRLRRRIVPVTAVAVSTLLVVSGAVAVATAPAYADDINATLALTKTTDDPVTPTGVVSPGETFEYDLLFSCGTSVPGVSGCKTATITDLLPEWIEFVSLSPFPVSAPGTSTVTDVGGRDQVTLEFTSPITTPGATTGLPLGTFQMTIQVKLADDAPWEIDGTTIINTAEITAANADPKTDSAPIDAVVPVNLATTTDKSFVPGSNYNMAGQTTMLSLTGTNHTNGGVDTLTVQDPVGAAPLAVDDTNPFYYLEFTDFGATTLPAGAEQVTAEVYSALDSTWHTVYVGAGPPVYPAAGPGIPDKSDIYGIRFTYTDTGGGRISVAATGTAEVSLTQRTTVESLTVATTIDNTVQSTVTLGADSANSPVVTKPYQIIPFGLQVSASKSFTPDQIKAGESTTVNLGAVNSGTATLSELTISEPGAGTPGSLSGDLTFAGFGTIAGGAGSGIQWPAGATEATIVYHYDGGTSSAPLSTTDAGTIPDSPSALRVVGFDITFAGSPIAAGAEAKTPFVVSTQRVGTPPDLTSVANDVDVTGTAFTDITLTDSDTATDTVEIYGDRLAVEVSKTIQPSQSWLVPGQQTVAQIPARISSFPATTVNATQVIVDDSAVLSPAWWDIYDATELPSLGIPSNATLTVQYTADGSTFTDLPGAVDLASPPAYQTVPIPSSLWESIIGLRFVYNAKPGQSFDPGSTFQPNITFTTRQVTRSGGPPLPISMVARNATIPDPSNPGGTIAVVQVSNCATADASADTPPLTAAAATTSPCPISTLVPIDGGSGIGPDLVDKDITPVTVVERSQAGTNGTLGWSTGGLTGVAQMRVTETGSTAYAPATSANLETSFLNAFDIIRLAPITKTTDPLIAYDTLVSVELFDYTAAGGAGAWVPIAGAPWDGPTSGNIVFPGYTLTDAERATTTGVRYTFEESPNRASVLTPGNFNQPAVGSGVAASTDRRPITVNFQLRDDRRSDGTPVLYGEAYNTAGDPSVVTNTVNAEACLEVLVGGDCAPGRSYSTNDSDTVSILNGTANITTTKSWSTGVSGGGALGIPPTGTPAADYPTTRMTLSVVNNGPQKVDTLDLEDPAPNVAFEGTAWDVFTLTSIISITPPKDTDAAGGNADVAVYLDLDGGGTLGPLTIAAATALTPTDLANVVGVRAYATGRISYTSGGNNDGRLQIQLDAQLRETLRSDPSTLVTAGTVNNTIFGSIGDPSVETSGACSVSSPPVSPDPNTVISCNNASIALSNTQDRTVLAAKSFSPTSEYENTNDRIRMLLSGQPGGNARSNQLVLTDTTPGFWNAYGFAGLVNANPNQFSIASPANRVQIQLLTGATYTVESDNSITVSGGTWNTVVDGSSNQWMTAAQARTALAPGAASATASILGGGTVTYGAVQGIRFTYQRVASGSISDPSAPLLLFENPANPTLTGNLFVQRRDALLTGGAVPTDLSGNTASPGTTSAGVYPNTVVADATGIPGNGSPATDDASANFTFRHLPTSVNLVKTPTGQVAPGNDFEVSLTTTNNGSYPIMNPVITDNLPVGGVTAGLPDYVFPAGVDPTDPANYTFSLSSGSSPGSPWSDLPVDPADITVVVTYSSGLDPEPVAIRFEFPTDSALGLGQVYRISWDMRLRSGAVANQPFVNQYEIDGDRDFDSCNSVAGTTNTCSTTAQVTTQPLATFGMQQEVRALDPQLGVISSDASTCTMADADPEGFFVAPCAPVTKPGQNNEWRLNYENWGSYPLDQVSTVIYLPNQGLSGIDIPSAESLWRPILASVAGPGLRADDTPTATRTVYYSTESPGTSLCDNVLNNGGTCPPGYWQPLTVGVDLTTVTALYVVVDFTGDLLQPGERFQLSFETTAPPAAFNPGTDPITWNSAKTGGKYTTGGTQRTLPPFEVPVVGASLASGSLQVSKSVDGAAAGAGWVPTSFDGTLSCISAGQPVPTSAIPAVPTLTAGSTVTVGGLPWGAECSFVETDAGSDVTLTPSSVTVTDDPASIELQSVTNTYEYASLLVEKTVEVPTPPGTTYPVPTGFEFTVVCTYDAAEDPEVLNETFTLNDGQSRLFEDLPARADCVVTETDPRDADSTVTSVTVVDPTVPPTTDQTARQATIPELSPDTAGGDTQNTVSYVNSYDLVALTITKDLEGEGAPQFGENQTFTAGVVCTFAGETLVNTTVDLNAGNAWTASLTGLIAGSECFITEPDLEGADAVVITPNDGTDTTTGVVTLPDTGTATVTVTNWYLTGSLEVTKVFDGAAATQYGTADFDLELVCVRGGDEVDIPGGNDRTVNVTTPTASWTHLPTGADCTLTETDTGGAGDTAILDAGGSVLVDPATSGYTFTVVTDPTILSVSDQPQPSLQVRNTFNYAEVSVSKHVDTQAVDDNGDPIPFGPFEVTLQCTFLSASVSANEPMTQTIADGDTFTWTGLPEGADCVIDETDTAGAASTTYTITQGGVTAPAEDGVSATLDPLPAESATDQTGVLFTNDYPVDPLIIRKIVDGTGASDVIRSFPVHVLCVLVDPSHPAPGLVVRDVNVEVGGPSNLAPEIDLLPLGSSCTITETDTGGAASVSITGTPYMGRPGAGGVPGTSTTVKDASITVTLTDDHYLVEITNTFIKPLPATGGIFAWGVPIGAALITVIGLMFVLWRRFEPGRD